MDREPFKGLRITVTGENSMARELATAIVKEAFVEKDFSDVQVLNPAAVPIQPAGVFTIYDIVMQHARHIFDEPVQIQGSFANFQDKNAEGAFGPEPVGRFQWDKRDKVWMQTPNDDPNGVTFYVMEKDAERVKADMDIKSLNVVSDYPSYGVRLIEA